MARILVESPEEFKRALERLARPQTHVIVTDGFSSITAVPRTTSRHRHYIQYSSVNEGEVAELVRYVEGRGFVVIRGIVQQEVAG